MYGIVSSLNNGQNAIIKIFLLILFFVRINDISFCWLSWIKFYNFKREVRVLFGNGREIIVHGCQVEVALDGIQKSVFAACKNDLFLKSRNLQVK